MLRLLLLVSDIDFGFQSLKCVLSRQWLEKSREEVLGFVFLVLAAGGLVCVSDSAGEQLVVSQQASVDDGASDRRAVLFDSDHCNGDFHRDGVCARLRSVEERNEGARASSVVFAWQP